MNTDELLEQMRLDDMSDQEFMTPVQYSKIRPIRPQQIYAWIRNETLSWKRCDCGRKVIRVEEADELLRSKGKLQPQGGENGAEDQGTTPD